MKNTAAVSKKGRGSSKLFMKCQKRRAVLLIASLPIGSNVGRTVVIAADRCFEPRRNDFGIK